MHPNVPEDAVPDATDLRVPTESAERLRVAATARTTILRAAHLQLEDDLQRLRAKAAAS